MQVLLYEKSYQRIAKSLAARVPEAEPVLWREDGTVTRAGQTVELGECAPRASWISSDLFATGKLAAFGEMLAGITALEWVQTANAGLDHPLYAGLAVNDVLISKSSAQSIPIAEYVLAYALEYAQELGVRRDAQAKGRWHPHRFRELWHSNWLIIGYGHIGANVAKRAKAFDCTTVVARQSTQGDAFTDKVIALSDVRAHLPRADFVVLACPATDATRGLVDATFLGAMKSDALLVNIARGSLIDEQALATSLDVGRPGRAVLDVFATEPLPEASPLWRHPRVTVTAHISNAGDGTRMRGDELFLSNLERFAAGDTPSDIAAAGS
jgi:phosphoglycerate dehydrogenase-like enzyme